jgi:hypothetical protein
MYCIVLSYVSCCHDPCVPPPVCVSSRFIAMSPSKKAVACQAPMEVIPLVLEPHSSFYVDPVIVLVSE